MHAAYLLLREDRATLANRASAIEACDDNRKGPGISRAPPVRNWSSTPSIHILGVDEAHRARLCLLFSICIGSLELLVGKVAQQRVVGLRLSPEAGVIGIGNHMDCGVRDDGQLLLDHSRLDHRIPGAVCDEHG